MKIIEWLWSLLPDNCQMPDCERRGMRGNENVVDGITMCDGCHAKYLQIPRCTYCRGTEFYEGPSGGMSTNILCANPECRHWFNYIPILGRLDDLNRVETGPVQVSFRTREAPGKIN